MFIYNSKLSCFIQGLALKAVPFALGAAIVMAPVVAAQADQVSIARQQDQEVERHMLGAMTRISAASRSWIEQPADVQDTACLDGLHGIDVNIFSADILDTWGLLYNALIDTLRNFACAFVVMYYNAKLSRGLDWVNESVQGPLENLKESGRSLGLPDNFLDQFDFNVSANPDGEYGAEAKIEEYSFVEEQGVGWLEDRLNNLGSSIWEDYDPSLFNERQAESKRARADVIQAAREAGEVPFGGKLVPTSKDDWRAIGSHLSWSGMTEGMAAVSTSIMVDLREFGLGQTSGLSNHALRQPISFAIDCMGASLGRSGQSVPGCFDD